MLLPLRVQPLNGFEVAGIAFVKVREGHVDGGVERARTNVDHANGRALAIDAITARLWVEGAIVHGVLGAAVLVGRNSVHGHRLGVVQRNGPAHFGHVHVDGVVGAEVGWKKLAHGAVHVAAAALERGVREIIPRMYLAHFCDIIGSCEHIYVAIEAGTAVSRILKANAVIWHILWPEKFPQSDKWMLVALKQQFFGCFCDANLLTVDIRKEVQNG